MANPENNSRAITDAQQGIHENLEKIVRKHCENPYKKPIAQHTLDAFNNIEKQVEKAISKGTPTYRLFLRNRCQYSTNCRAKS